MGVSNTPESFEYLLLNSGMGTRMGVLTSDQPKCMTEIYGRETIIGRQLAQLLDVGIKEAVITVGAHENVLKEYVMGLSTNKIWCFSSW